MAEVATLISGKVDLNAKKFTRDERGTLYHDKNINASRRHRNPIYVCTKQQCFETHWKKKTPTRTEEKQKTPQLQLESLMPHSQQLLELLDGT